MAVVDLREHDWTADAAAVLVVDGTGRVGVRKIVGSVEGIIVRQEEAAAVKLIRTRAACDNDRGDI